MSTTHKQDFKGLWNSGALCGAYPIVTVSSPKWKRVTCKRCLRMKRKAKK